MTSAHLKEQEASNEYLNKINKKPKNTQKPKNLLTNNCKTTSIQACLIQKTF